LTDTLRPYRGRFAPSPTGDLHFGSLIAAVASFLEARSNGGRWLIRVEDIDPPREVAGSADRIIHDLGRFGMTSDAEILYQSTRKAAYDHAIELLVERGDAYWCGCSRSELHRSGNYPGTCREGIPPGREPRSVRLNTHGANVNLLDRLQGQLQERLEESVGDFVIRRADGLPAYQLESARHSS
jgi:glutamyl-Q tRNA(Asp) synthetase